MNAPEVCHFQPGQLVECIDDEWYDENGRRPDGVSLAVEGCVYTVRRVDEFDDRVFIWLAEVGGDCGFWSIQFRPIQTPNIDCFLSLLAPSPASPREVQPA